MEQRVSLITLGVRELARARRFYETLGWTSGSDPDIGVVFFQAGGMVVALWDRAELSADCGIDDDGGSSGIALAHNVGSREEVDAILAEAEKAGGKVTRSAADTFWGGYSGVFLDLDGHAWEVAVNPHWTLLEDGSVRLPA